jgi:exopolysaccharide biosynthesis WecB/TagA/CpsF family protein
MKTVQSVGHPVQIGPVEIVGIEHRAALDFVFDTIAKRSFAVIGFCNAHTINLARRDKTLTQALAQMTVFNDGVGVNIARKVLYGTSFPANLNGTDMTPAVLDQYPRPLAIFLVGSAPGVAERAADALRRDYPRHRIVGTHHGFFTASEEASLAETIKAAAPDLVLAGMGQPKQEIWAVHNSDRLDCTILCVGAIIDRFAGIVPRAPAIVRKSGLEWAYRLVLEPRRLFNRYVIGNAVFLRNVYKDKAMR